MIQQMFESTSIPVLEQVVNFAQTRHGVLAGNLANLEPVADSERYTLLNTVSTSASGAAK